MIGETTGHYRITSKLGAGGRGEMFLAEDTRLERKARRPGKRAMAWDLLFICRLA